MDMKTHADEAYARYSRVVSTYRYSTAGLQANPVLLAHANKSITPKKGKRNSGLDIEAYLERLRSGEGRWAAARELGIEPRDVKRKLQFDKKFHELVLMAEEEAAEQVEAQLWLLAGAGEKWAMQEWLKKRYKDRWGDEPQVVKHEGSVQHEISAAPLLEQIAALQAVLEQRAELTSGNDGSIIDIDDDDIEDVT